MILRTESEAVFACYTASCRPPTSGGTGGSGGGAKSGGRKVTGKGMKALGHSIGRSVKPAGGRSTGPKIATSDVRRSFNEAKEHYARKPSPARKAKVDKFLKDYSGLPININYRP